MSEKPFGYIAEFWIDCYYRFRVWLPLRWKCLLYDHTTTPSEWATCSRCGKLLVNF